jgi:hypothetical protein
MFVVIIKTSQVELPHWLPLEVVVKVMTAFEKILIGEITTMQHHSKHGPSQSGDSRGRNNPDSSDGEEDTVMFQEVEGRKYHYLLPVADDLL